MAIEHACMQVVRKPWGSTDLRPWSELHNDGDAVGELWFQRAETNAPDSSLLLKLLFTKEALSIQVHPDDTFAHSMGLANGKTEAWYVLSATPAARVAVGLKRELTPPQLRAAIEDGSISDLIDWRHVIQGEIISVPAGTIHAIGPGLVIAEIQQRSDTTFRLFDHGRPRELHIENAVAVSHAGPAKCQPTPLRLTDSRTLLVANSHFVLERFDLAPKSTWRLNAEQETWLLILDGRARIGSMNAFIGEVIFLEADSTDIKAGPDGLKGLLAYLGPQPRLGLLRKLDITAECTGNQSPPRPMMDQHSTTMEVHL